MTTHLTRVEELLGKHRSGTDLATEELTELGELHLQALYSICQEIDDDEQAAKLMKQAWVLYTRNALVKDPIERMNRAGAEMYQSLFKLHDTIEKL